MKQTYDPEVPGLVYETESHWVSKERVGYKVWSKGITHSTRVGIYGSGEKYLALAIARADDLTAEHKENKNNGLR